MNLSKKKINRSILIGIAGGSGSGETFVAQNLLIDMRSEKVLPVQHNLYG